MNVSTNLSKYDQYLFYYYSVSKKRRFIKYIKDTRNLKDIKTIQTVYNYSTQKSIDVGNLITKDQIKLLIKKLDSGGKRGKQ